MPKKNPAVQAKRQEVLRKHSNAMRKMRRLERVNGAKIAGTELDPTRDRGKVSKYNSKQLAAYESELSAFLSRKVQYVGDAHGRPMPKQMWDSYVSLKKQESATAVAELKASEHIFMPFAGQTIGDRISAMTSDRPHMQNPAVTNARDVVDLKPSRVASKEALETLLVSAKDKVKAGYRDYITKQRRDNFAAIAQDAPDDIRQRADALTDHQFNVLWAFTDFVDELSTHYQTARTMSSDSRGMSDKAAASVMATSENLLGSMLDWAEKL